MPKIISEEEVKHIAALARLGISADAIKTSTKDLANILEHFSQIQKIDTKNTPTSDDVTGLQNVTRPDTAKPELLCGTEKLLTAAPEVHKRHIKVKAVF